MKKKFRYLCGGLSLFIALGVAGCSRSETGDKSSDNALKAFEKILKKYPKEVGFHKTLSHWGFKLPGGDKFEWTKNTSANEIDYAMIIQGDAFVEAGFNPKKFDNKKWLFKPSEVEDGTKLPDRIIKPLNVSDKNQISSGSKDALRRVIKQKTKLISYDEDAHYYKLSLGDGNEVWWTDKLNRNTADMVFVIEAKPFSDAGVDMEKLKKSGWELMESGQMDHDNMESGQDHLMKVYNLK